jgi:hypothetical protein
MGFYECYRGMIIDFRRRLLFWMDDFLEAEKDGNGEGEGPVEVVRGGDLGIGMETPKKTYFVPQIPIRADEK